MSKGPPGWEPHRITTRIDGYFLDPRDEDRIPAVIAKIMADGMPQPSQVEMIRARMVARMIEHGLGYE
jgi:hypothetical protein